VRRRPIDAIRSFEYLLVDEVGEVQRDGYVAGANLLETEVALAMMFTCVRRCSMRSWIEVEIARRLYLSRNYSWARACTDTRKKAKTLQSRRRRDGRISSNHRVHVLRHLWLA
jgi:hypothetical protein